MTIKSSELSIVIPAYNEANKIAADIAAADTFLSQDGEGGEIIVVDDGSSDDTLAIVHALQKSYPRLRVVTYPRNHGKGYAVAQGVRNAQGSFILFADAGLCVPYEIARSGLAMLELDLCDIAHGSRRMPGSVKRAQPFHRRLGARLFSILVHTLMGVPGYISDTQCGFKLYRAQVAKELFAELETYGLSFDIEIILRALRKGYRVAEFPVIWTADSQTHFHLGRYSLGVLRDLAKMRWRLTFISRARGR